MNIFKTLAFGAVALGALAIGTPAQAHDHHHHHDHDRHWGYHRDRVVIYGGPRYYRPYYYDDYYAPAYSYYRPYPYYGYYGGPSLTFAFGGHGHYYHRWHHR